MQELLFDFPEYQIDKKIRLIELFGGIGADFKKAEKVNSNTQLYKQAGNAIVKQVLMAIFRQMNIKGVEPWNK